ncbi:MAG: ribonuclease H-like domain-containing protein [Candidatus Marinimicrobia bacterium]|nr:ribonuclease H-like domain-containing protein [Candidatus Neomarinimicrobiota bacterium]MBL7022460.1 ribonuclease H-like domain-containing protein [Candidatus Neomarinimicrobiota bacterium]MBL7108685.1 ribonuclease H-like domain-containing protein [Candidatus Neomarinimicrobiota bacterium]
MNYIILDIETVPQPNLPETIEEEVEKQVRKKLERAEIDRSDAESLIRSVSPFFGQVLCVGLRWYSGGSQTSKDKVICEKDEETTLNKFFEIINSQQSQNVKFVHYNGLGFDIPFLVVRAAHYGISINNKTFRDLRRFSYRCHIDLMMFLSNWNNYNATKLDIVCQSFGIPSPKEGEVKGETVAKAFEEGNIKAVEEYVMRDVEATYQLFLKLQRYILL